MDKLEKGEEIYDSFAEFAMRIYKHAPVVLGAMGFFRMWMKALHMARPENPELFSFYFVRSLKYLDAKNRLAPEFYESTGPRLNYPNDLDKKLSEQFQERVDCRVNRLKNVFAGELEAGKITIEKARQTLEQDKKIRSKYEQEKHIYEKDVDNDTTAQFAVIKQRPKIEQKKLMGREQLLRELVDKILVSDQLQRQIKLSRELGNMKRVEEMARQLAGKAHHTETLDEKFFDSQSEDEMAILMSDTEIKVSEKKAVKEKKPKTDQNHFKVRSRRHKVIPYNQDSKVMLNRQHGVQIE